ncbi:MAG: histidine kinase [Methylophilaceae bacterium]|nr:histidine kinase [Methylophilaceae bacterium]
MRKSSRIPNFRNLGINLRLLIIVNVITTLAAIFLSSGLSGFLLSLTTLLAFVLPILISSMLLLYAAQPALNKLPYFAACGIILLVLPLITLLFLSQTSDLLILDATQSSVRPVLFTLLVTMIVLYYFNLQHRAYSPAMAEARLQALQARIRPHFLFNCINAVLSLIRTQPKRAETALEDMADLFRVLMADNRDLVPLAQEIALCRQYLALEKLRLEERLNMTWQIDNMPPEALIPPLVLQPLLENAVYHGIEPLPKGGEIIINVKSIAKEIHILISNPYSISHNQHIGNKMALGNIKERLLLHFDLEARLTSAFKNNRYEVHIVIPHLKNTNA